MKFNNKKTFIGKYVKTITNKNGIVINEKIFTSGEYKLLLLVDDDCKDGWYKFQASEVNLESIPQKYLEKEDNRYWWVQGNTIIK